MKRNSTLKVIAIFFFALTLSNYSDAQCCGGGGGSPIVGGASQGVLLERQVEVGTYFQFISSDKFYSGSTPSTAKTFDGYQSTYEYFRLAYGVSKYLTMSVESGYYYNKKEIGLNQEPTATFESKGFGDLILFPRYNFLNRTKNNHRTEATIGLGFKIPLGSYNDSTEKSISVLTGPIYYYVTKPPSVQLTSGAQDVIFYAFLLRGYTKQNFRLFANAFYIKKGYSPNGEKLGDFASVSLFAGKSFFKKIGVTLQARYEWVDKMTPNETIFLFGTPSNYNPEATGYKKVFISPQISYTKGKFTIYVSTDLPLYQKLNSDVHYTQLGSEYQSTLGISFKFFTPPSSISKTGGTGIYSCPMHPEETSDIPGICSKCKMDLVKNANCPDAK